MAEIASSAVKPLLSLISNEAQLQRGISGNIQFIKDEVEMMDGFLQNLARSKAGGGGDHQLRVLTEQVMDLVYDSKVCIAEYEWACRRGRKGLVDLLLRMVWLPRWLLVRRRFATQIRGLKVRMRYIGERQQRYNISVPPDTDSTPQAQHQRSQKWLPSTHPARDSSRWAVLAGPDILTQAKAEVLQWLVVRSEKIQPQSWLKTNILGVVTLDGVHGASLADQVYQHCRGSSLAMEPLDFDCVVHITIQRPPLLRIILLDMLRQLCSEEYLCSMSIWELDVDRITSEIRECLRGKRLLLLLSNMDYPTIWCFINKRLQTFPCSARSFVVFCTNDSEVATKCYPSEMKVYSLVDFFSKKAVALFPTKFDLDEDRSFHLLLKQILVRCSLDVYSMNLFLNALLSNPNRTEQELESLSGSLHLARCAPAIERQSLMLTFCYHGLHKDYQNCLWYSTVFTRGTFKVRRASLLRRWVAEGLIKGAGMAEADRCFDALFAQKLLLPREVCGTGKIKSCGLNALFIPMITGATTDEAFPDANQPPADLLHLDLSICKAIKLLRIMTESATVVVDGDVSRQWNTRTEQKRATMMAFLKYLPTPSRFQLLRVLELEDYKGFTKRHIKNICKIHQLKYLNLRNTDVKQLPEEINQLELLETLDIRGTRVTELNAVLPMLKHLLAGRISFAGKKDTVKSKESFSTVRLRYPASWMKTLEVLSHVEVSNNVKEWYRVAWNMPRLRKLGVVLSAKKDNNHEYIFDEISQFNGYMASLSIRVGSEGNQATDPAAVLTLPATVMRLPSCLQSLRICGIVGWLPSSIIDLHQLTKITLRETSLTEDVIPILGSLEGLVCLRLLYHALVAATPVFGGGQFRSLKDLVVEDGMIHSITFAPGTSPLLGKMVWSFNHMKSLSGVQNLPSLRYLELRGTYEPNVLTDLQLDIPNHVK